MLRLVIPATELFDEAKQEFVSSKEQVLQLEHSLVSLSKWESKWLKPFLTKENKTREESIDYIRCMTLTQNVPENTYNSITMKIIDEVSDYIEAPMSATILPKDDKKGTSHEQVTAELIYYWMVALNVPFDPCQKWHLNRLLMLINVCNIKSNPKKKMSKKEIISRNKKLNDERRAKYNTKG